jgi:hypothetical protein
LGKQVARKEAIMGGIVAKGFPNQAASGSLYGNLNQPNLGQALGGRRGIPGGPILPTLPRNPLATTARRIGKALNTPARWPPDRTL